MYTPLLLGFLVLAPGAECAAPPPPPDTVPAASQAGLRLALNLPAFRLDVVVDGHARRSYRVAVGTRRYPTPTGDFAVSRVVWNPWWHPPDSEWARRERPAPPGPANPLGRVKLTFRELYHLHGTPSEGSLGRAASHGCVRMANRDVIELARLVHAYASPEPSGTALDSLEADPVRTAAFRLATPVPLRIVYRVAEVRAGRLELHPDVYRRAAGGVEAEALRALAAAGIPAERVDRARLAALVRAGRRASAAAPLPELFVPAPAADPGARALTAPAPAPRR